MAIMTVQTEQPNSSWAFKLSSINDLKALSRDLDISLPVQEDLSPLAEPVELGPLRLANSFAVHPMEGADGDDSGRPGSLTLRRYERFARGGAALLWAEAIAVAPEGRANPRQLWLNGDSKAAFADMIRRTRQAAADGMGAAHSSVIVAQLTHSGRYSKPDGTSRPLIVQRDPYRDPLTPEPYPNPDRPNSLPDDHPIVTDEYLDSLQQAYVEAARLAFDAGFDAVDIKACHGYLVNELLACHTRPGRYGGSFENRTRFLLEVIDRIHRELGDDKQVCVRLGCYDAIPYPYGWAVDKDDYTRPDLAEPHRLLSLLQQRGVRLINFTIANPYYNPHVGRPFNQPIKGGYTEPEHPAVGASRLIALAGELQQAFPQLAIVGTGYSWLRQLMPNVMAAVKTQGLARLFGAGRMALAYPDFARDILLKGRLDSTRVCVACSACTQIMRDGGTAGCVVRDNGVYGPIFTRGRRHDRETLAALAESCMQCQSPTCQQACPARIDIPQFVDQFLRGDDRGAYETIRHNNILPELCAELCPVAQQCQGNCLQRFIGAGAIPIADIQRYLAKKANKLGWSKLRIPATSTGKKIAIIGAGPAGIAAATQLLEAGHAVTFFDGSNKLGGMVNSVIPADRHWDSLANEIATLFKDVPPDRMALQLGKELTADNNLDAIIAQGFDAAFVGIGLQKTIRSSTEGLCGLYDALEFLALAKKSNDFDLTGKRIAVVGGGNTAMDAAVAASRAGATDVYLIYRRSFAQMPAWTAERDRALDMGVHFIVLTQQLAYNSSGGRLTSVRLCPTVLGQPDATGRRKPIPQQQHAYDLEMDMVVEAIGQQAQGDIDRLLPSVELQNGLVKTTDGSFHTTRRSVFAGGDLLRGPSTVVAAVADGMAAAREIDTFLTSSLGLDRR